MNARLIVALMLLMPGVALAKDPVSPAPSGFKPVGWSPAERWTNRAPPNQKAKPKEAWDTPVDAAPDWTQQADWDQKEKAPRTTSVPR